MSPLWGTLLLGWKDYLLHCLCCKSCILTRELVDVISDSCQQASNEDVQPVGVLKLSCTHSLIREFTYGMVNFDKKLYPRACNEAILYQKRHIWQKWLGHKMKSLLKGHREEESAVWKIGLSWEREEWLCGCFGDHQTVVSTQQGHTDGPLMNRWTAGDEKAGEVIQNVDMIKKQWKEQQRNWYLRLV